MASGWQREQTPLSLCASLSLSLTHVCAVVTTTTTTPSYRNEWWVPGKIVEIRHRLADNWRSSGNRDVLLLDIALDNYFRWGHVCVWRRGGGGGGGACCRELLNAMLNGEETGKGLQGFMAN